MKLRVLSLPAGQLAKIAAVVMALVATAFVVPMILFTLAAGVAGVEGGEDPAITVAMLLLMPFFYLVVGYLWTALFVWIFNKVTAHMGGIDVEVEALPPASPPPPPAGES